MNLTVPPLPDVAAGRESELSQGASYRALQHVGMQGIAIRLQWEDGTRLPATADVGVDLAAGQRGIHMSRLYRLLDRLDESPLTPDRLDALGHALLDSQHDTSQRLYLALRLYLPLRRRALLSDASGWRHYPFTLALEGSHQGLIPTLTLELDYASTCPCSTALARHAMARDWRHWAEEQKTANLDADAVADWIERSGSFPTPHSQRSRAVIALRLAEAAPFATAARIDSLEQTLQTPVQTLVKRIDEQAFAERNGANLMFCEDAARRLAEQCEAQSDVLGYRVDITHAESLHAHDAVARAERDFEPR
ncbi:GTP cyclohydrolase FolE2 [Salinicola salarius]|uniref:GTP cyclohydrolase FolE2 n=1 Tax=Salinicola salarius TaxID=430457 RepID=UPI0023E3CD8C|nr:GTP cyclohydrolase FolE2 [Salinicola salarius]MDF3917871.1 GTP cyclohydrolase FolE2 [Salinicola salarius]